MTIEKSSEEGQVRKNVDVSSPLASTTPDFQMMVQNAEIGLTQVDTGSGRLLYANPCFCKMIGYSLAEIVEHGITFVELTHPDDLANNIVLQRQLLHGQIDRYTLTKRYRRKDGTFFWGRATAAAMARDKGNRVLMTLGTIEDISGEMAERGRLKAAESLAGLAHWFRDFETRRATCSPSYNALFGVPEDTPAPSFEEFLSRVHPHDRDRVIATAQRAWKGNMFTCEHRIVRPSGEIRWLSHTIKRICGPAGDVIGQVGSCVDITDGKSVDVRSSSMAAARCRKFIEENWRSDINPAAVASAAGVSTRSLYKICSEVWGYTPAEYIKRIRLEQARDMLRQPDATSTVTQIAMKCSFSNLGHFARDYRLAFGERPSDTLRRAQLTT